MFNNIVSNVFVAICELRLSAYYFLLRGLEVTTTHLWHTKTLAIAVLPLTFGLKEILCAGQAETLFLVIDLLLPTGVPKKTIIKAGQDAVKEAIENTVKVLGPQAIKQLPREQLGVWVAVSTLKESSAGIKEMFKQAARPTDITKLIQLSQTMSGNPSRLFESGASLMAKKEGRIFIAIPDPKNIPPFLGEKGVNFFKQTGENLVVGVIVESEPGQAGLRKVVEQTRVVNDQILAWKKNVSAIPNLYC